MKGSEALIIFRVGPLGESVFNIVIIDRFELPFSGSKVEIVFIKVPHVIDVFSQNIKRCLVGGLM